jgi:hypothetical protein
MAEYEHPLKREGMKQLAYANLQRAPLRIVTPAKLKSAQDS